MKILANKDALYNADGNVNLTGNNAVLGKQYHMRVNLVYLKTQNRFRHMLLELIFQTKIEELL